VLAGTNAIFIILLLEAGTLLGGSNPLPTELNRVLHASWRSYSRHHIQAHGQVSLGARLSLCMVMIPRPLPGILPLLLGD
jgi:hypothetical protein